MKAILIYPEFPDAPSFAGFMISAVNTKVTTKNGVVTLKGKARNAAEIDLVTKIVEDVKGVKSVKNKMTSEESK